MRRITAEEAKDGHIFVTKNKLRMFPEVGKEFSIVQGSTPFKAAMEGVPCVCAGVSFPHLHYRVRCDLDPPLVAGEIVRIKRMSPDSYEISRNSDIKFVTEEERTPL